MLNPALTALQEQPFYTVNSMRRVFRPGDRLQVRQVPFEELQPGDIICFFSAQQERQIVHRIIQIAPGKLITQGDNNAARDAAPVTPAQNPRRVTAVIRGRHTVPVAAGADGCREFQRHQRRRRLRAGWGRLLRPCWSWAPLRFARFWLPPVTVAHFGDRTMLYVGRRPLASRRPLEPWQWHASVYRLFFPAAQLDHLAARK